MSGLSKSQEGYNVRKNKILGRSNNQQGQHPRKVKYQEGQNVKKDKCHESQNVWKDKILER